MSIEYKPHIGKNVIETLTLGMYDDSRFVYREYIQNAADQIDIAVEEEILTNSSEGKIVITIDKIGRNIEILDNATGIRTKEVLSFLGDVANSSKDKKLRKGFRGIGRLGGLGYCEKLEFETSYKGESEKSIITLDANLLKKLIEDKSYLGDASAVISIITSVDYEKEESDNHYFKVKLNKVTNKNSVLLDAENVKEYLSMVAPLPFGNDFSFKKEIEDHYSKMGIDIDTYNVEVNGYPIFKAYKNFLIEKEEKTPLVGVDFFEVRDGVELLALGWYGYRGRVNVVLEPKNIERGIRIRKGNITIGDEDTLKRFFKAERTNLRFIGELHVVSSKLVPNARRDYFNESKSTEVFDQQLRQIFKEENWENRLAQTASYLYNRLEDIEDYKKSKDDLENEKVNFTSAKHKEQYIESLKEKEIKAKKASKIISNISKKARSDGNVQKLYQHIVGDKELSVDEGIQIPKIVFDPPTFNKLTDSQTEVVREIFGIIDDVLSSKDAEKLKKRILDRFN